MRAIDVSEVMRRILRRYHGPVNDASCHANKRKNSVRKGTRKQWPRKRTAGGRRRITNGNVALLMRTIDGSARNMECRKGARAVRAVWAPPYSQAFWSDDNLETSSFLREKPKTEWVFVRNPQTIIQWLGPVPHDPS